MHTLGQRDRGIKGTERDPVKLIIRIIGELNSPGKRTRNRKGKERRTVATKERYLLCA